MVAVRSALRWMSGPRPTFVGPSAAWCIYITALTMRVMTTRDKAQVEEQVSEQPGDPEAVVVDLLEALRESVSRAKQRAGDVSRPLYHAGELAVDMLHQRAAFTDAFATVKRVHDEKGDDLFLREFERAYRRNPYRLPNADGRADMITQLHEIFLEAMSEVRRILRSADEYRAAGEPTAEDRAYRQAVREATSKRWDAA